MFFKYDNLKYYFMGNLVFKREGKCQQKRTGVEYLKAVGNACAANPKLCKLVIYTVQLSLREKKTHNGLWRCRNNYKRVPTSPSRQTRTQLPEPAPSLPRSSSTAAGGGGKVQRRHRPRTRPSPGRPSPQALAAQPLLTAGLPLSASSLAGGRG